MSRMQFRGFSFSRNPQSIIISRGNRLAGHVLPGGGTVVQALGTAPATITCKGSFFGASFAEAAAELENFRAEAAGKQAGLLFVPGLEPMQVYLREIVCEASADGRILPYTMVFVEGAVD